LTDDEIEPFHAMSIGVLAHRLAAEGRSVIHMEFGQPSTGAPRAAIETAHRVLDSEPFGYWESQPLKTALSRHYRDAYGLDVDPGRFVLTCGASPALVLALISSFRAGDRVALARPGYVAYRNTLKALHMRPVEIACGPDVRYQLTAEALAALDPAPQGVIVASPANPTGTIIAPDDLAAIAELCRARGIRIVSDEIYHGLSYAGPTHSMLEYAPDAELISSFSKYFSMVGWRLGWLLASAEQAPRARAYMSNLFLTAPSMSQHAGVAALASRAELDGHVAVYRRNRQLLLDALPALGLAAIAPPDGAFYIYADVGHMTDDSLAFCEALLRDTGVATAPGIDFDPVDGRHFLRMSFAVSTPEIEQAIQRMIPWFAEARAKRGRATG
jgi:aspartate/methionine/tyrosine aminotransferase